MHGTRMKPWTAILAASTLAVVSLGGFATAAPTPTSGDN